jgi:hypothetical protein
VIAPKKGKLRMLMIFVEDVVAQFDEDVVAQLAKAIG